MHVRLAPQARADLDAIWLYIAEDSGNFDLATRIVDRIRETFDLLAKFPELGRRRDTDIRPGIRSLIVDTYVVLYRIRSRELQIARVAHGNQDLSGLFPEE